MAQSSKDNHGSHGDKKDKPSVTTYADHEVITPPNKLRRFVSTTTTVMFDDDPVTRAEQALAQLSGEFPSWMNQECERLDQARREVKEKGFTKATCQSLFHAAHDMKGQAATFGYPAVAAPAVSLCRLIEHTPDMTRIPLTLVDQHVDAIRAIVRENARPDVQEIADALTRRLREVTDEFLAHENRDRPDVLEGILAPSLAPNDPPA
jgi:HPt (histidine-containing phosphotransfer) domain-containing protein